MSVSTDETLEERHASVKHRVFSDLAARGASGHDTEQGPHAIHSLNQRASDVVLRERHDAYADGMIYGRQIDKLHT